MQDLIKIFTRSKNTIKIYESMLRAKTIDDEIKELENIKQKLKDEGYYHK